MVLDTEATRYRHLQGECPKPYRPARHCPQCAAHVMASGKLALALGIPPWRDIGDTEFDEVRAQLDAAIGA